MRLRNGYLLAGVVWALFLAPVAAYGVVGLIAGVLWLYVFGDNPWPAATDWVIPVIGLIVFVSVTACCIYLARRYGRQQEIEADGDTAREWRTVYLVTMVPLVLIAITALSFYQRSVHHAEAIAATDQRQAVFNDLVRTRHTISELVVRRTDDGDVEARVAMSGERQGAYRLLWKVNSMIYGEVLSGEVHNLNLGVEGDELNFEIPIDEIARSYRDTILNGGGVAVDEPFELVVTLLPEIDGDDIEAWPAFERSRWEQGDSPLRNSVTTEIQVRFRVGRDGTIDHSTP